MKAEKRILCVLLLLLFIFPIPVKAMGEHVNFDNTKNSCVVVIGNRRVYDLANRVKTYRETKEKYSFNGTRAAHYIYRKDWVTGKWADKNLVVFSPKYLKEQKTLVRKALKQHGKCIVVLETTINVVNETDPSYEEESLKRILILRKKLLGIKVKYKGKIRTPSFRITSVIPPINNDSRVTRFNATLKKKFGHHYIYLGLNKTWKGLYVDRLHLTNKGNDKFYNILKRALK